MQVALKIWRVDPQSGERALREYEVDAPEWATLLDVLDIVKDRHDGTLAYRKSCRMMICGSCGMRMDGAAVLACKMRMYDIAQAGHVPVISAMGNLPVIKDLVVDMEPFWAKFRAVDPYLRPGYAEPPASREHLVSQEQMNVIHKESLCINCGACVSECNAMESDPRLPRPAGAREGDALRRRPARRHEARAARAGSGKNGIWQCTRCYFCNERCPKGVDPRDAIAKLGAESIKEGIDRDMGAKHAKWFVTSARTTGWLRETELVPKTQGIVESIRQTKFALKLARVGKVPPPFPPHVAKNVKRVAAALRPRAGAGPQRLRRHRPGRARAREARARPHDGDRDPYGEGSFPRPKPLPEELEVTQRRAEARRVLQGLPRLALGEGARLVDAGARAEGRPRARGARVGHLLRRRRHPRGRARLLPAPERAHPLLRRRDRLRHAAHGLQRLHAEPAPGELGSSSATPSCAPA